MTSPDRKIVTPTVGRKVWFRPNGSMQKMPCADGRVVLPEFCSIEQPMDATVIFVHGHRMVNLDITDHIGQRFVARSVTLLQDGDCIPDTGFYCEWMPYQTGQAKKEAANAVRSTPPPWEPGKAPRVTLEDVDNEIVGETYSVMPSGRVTVCELTLRNGFTVRGEASVVFIENNVPELGRQYAREDAVRKVWPLLGYALREKHS